MKQSIHEITLQFNIQFNAVVKSKKYMRANEGFNEFIQANKGQITFTDINEKYMENPPVQDELYFSIINLKQLIKKAMMALQIH